MPYSSTVIQMQLKAILERENLTIYRLSKHLKTTKQRNLYSISNGNSLPSLETVDDILNALHVATGKPFTISDLLEFSPD